MTTKPESTTEETLEPCPNPECQSNKVAASNDFANYYVYCPDCFLRGPRESEDHFGARWNALARISPASTAPVVDESELRFALEGMIAAFDTDDYSSASIVATTRECALSVAKQAAGWPAAATAAPVEQSEIDQIRARAYNSIQFSADVYMHDVRRLLRMFTSDANEGAR